MRSRKSITKCRFSCKIWITIKHQNLLSHIKMGGEIATFDDIEIGKHKFHRYKNPIF